MQLDVGRVVAVEDSDFSRHKTDDELGATTLIEAEGLLTLVEFEFAQLRVIAEAVCLIGLPKVHGLTGACSHDAAILHRAHRGDAERRSAVLLVLDFGVQPKMISSVSKSGCSLIEMFLNFGANLKEFSSLGII